MKVSLTPGKYVVAVSGGVDSMVLLDLLSKIPQLKLVVAHFEHGIREDSDFDRQLVEKTAKQYGLPFVYERGSLGTGTSEALAREARYAFLRRARDANQAKAILTAHHEDDVIETAILNMLRGTGRKGLSSLGSSEDIVRPFLHISKRDIYAYAAAHPDIVWHNDSTNDSDQYLRNYIRRHLLQNLDEASRSRLLEYIKKANATNPIIDSLLVHDINVHTRKAGLDRQWFTMLPYDVSCEVMAAWLRQHKIREFDRKLIERLVVAAKVAASGKVSDINAGHLLKVGKTTLHLTPRTPS